MYDDSNKHIFLSKINSVKDKKVTEKPFMECLLDGQLCPHLQEVVQIYSNEAYMEHLRTAMSVITGDESGFQTEDFDEYVGLFSGIPTSDDDAFQSAFFATNQQAQARLAYINAELQRHWVQVCKQHGLKLGVSNSTGIGDGQVSSEGILRMGHHYFLGLPAATRMPSAGLIMYPRFISVATSYKHVWWHPNDYMAVRQHTALTKELADIWCEAHSFDGQLFAGLEWQECVRRVTIISTFPMCKRLDLKASQNGLRVLKSQETGITWEAQLPNDLGDCMGASATGVYHTYNDRQVAESSFSATAASDLDMIKMQSSNQGLHIDVHMREVFQNSSLVMLGPISDFMRAIQWKYMHDVVDLMAEEVHRRGPVEEDSFPELDEGFNLEISMSGPPGCPLRSGIQQQPLHYTIPCGSSELFINSTVHAGAGLSSRAREVNNRFHVVLYRSKWSDKSTPVGKYAKTSAFVPPPVLCGVCAQSAGGQYHGL